LYDLQLDLKKADYPEIENLLINSIRSMNKLAISVCPGIQKNILSICLINHIEY